MTNPNYVDSTGLHTQTVTEIVTNLQDGFKAIYGANINLNANSPDAQMINIFAQAMVDTLEAIAQVYNSFSPETAVGSVLDQRCAINGVVRKGASFTRTDVDVVVDRPVTLLGIDTNPDNAFIIQDLTANKFALQNTVSLTAGTHTLEFISVVPGQIETIPNTITVITTVTLGVTGVNNPNSAISTGENQETDIELRLRRSQAVSVPSQGYLPGLTGALLGLTNVVDVKVYENDSNTTDIYGIPGHSIWAIVDGGADSDIAEIIYNKRNAGCGMKGSEIVMISQVNGLDFAVKFDRPVYENLYVSLTIESISPTHLIDADYLKQVIYDQISYTIYQPADYTAITTVVKEADPYAVVVSGGVSSDGLTFVPFLYPTTLASRFLLSIPRINITVI